MREQYEEFKSRPPPQRGYGDRAPSTGYGGSSGYGDRQNSDRSSSYGGGYGGYGNTATPPNPNNAMSPPGQSAPGAGSPTTGADYAAQIAQYYGGNDPYAAYGGYQAQVVSSHNLFVMLTKSDMFNTTNTTWLSKRVNNSHRLLQGQALDHPHRRAKILLLLLLVDLRVQEAIML